MEIILINALLMGKILVLSWLITKFEPLHIIVEMLPDNILFNLFRLMIGCLMCVSFWTTLYLTGDIYISSLNAFIAFWYNKTLGWYENRVRLN